MLNLEQLDPIDLNLLLQLHALLQERSVTQAAKRVHKTQSALSHALGKLRELFDDQLLVRSGSEMVLTPRAEQLLPVVEDALQTVYQVFRPPAGFDAARLRHSFTLSMTDMLELTLLPGLLWRLEAEAPHVQLRCRVSAQPEDDIQAGLADLAIGVLSKDLSGLLMQRLSEDRFVGLVSAKHQPFDPKTVTVEEYAKARHLLVAPRGEPGSVVDRALKALGLEREVVAQIPHFVAAPLILANTSAVLTVPETLARQLVALGAQVEVFEPPLELPTIPFAMMFHQSRRQDPAHIWLRAMIQSVFKEPARDDE